MTAAEREAWNRRVWVDGDRRAPFGRGDSYHAPGSTRRIGTPTRKETGRLLDPDYCTDVL